MFRENEVRPTPGIPAAIILIGAIGTSVAGIVQGARREMQLWDHRRGGGTGDRQPLPERTLHG